MKKRIFAVILVLAMMIPFFSAVSFADGGPSAADLDEINAKVAYPKDEDYLDEYKTLYVSRAMADGIVWGVHGLSDGPEWCLSRYSFPDLTEVKVIAEHSFTQGGREYCYACCIYKDEDGNDKAGWVNSAYLTDISDNKDNPASIIGTWYRKVNGEIDKDTSLVFEESGKLTITRYGKTAEWVWGQYLGKLITFNCNGTCSDTLYLHDGVMYLNWNEKPEKGSFGEQVVYVKDLPNA